MDIVGPLPRSARGHQYILVVTDYATRYPEAVPMKNIDADRVAEELVNIFSRVGLTKEILTDQGANFQFRTPSGDPPLTSSKCIEDNAVPSTD